MKIQDKTVVACNFKLYDQDNNLIDSSDNEGPLMYLHGMGELLPGLEVALSGHEVGDKFEVPLSADDAFGDVDERLIDVVPRSSFPGIDVIEVGMRFETEMEDGSVVLVRVIDVDDKTVTVDGNHELAGRDIRFELEVIEVRQATETELQHGHAHGADGHCHG